MYPKPPDDQNPAAPAAGDLKTRSGPTRGTYVLIHASTGTAVPGTDASRKPLRRAAASGAPATGGVSFVAYADDGQLARLARITSNADGSASVYVVGTYQQLREAVEAGHWHAERQARADAAEYECRRCGYPIARVGGAWTVVDDTTTAGGLTYCPPNPDAAPVGAHLPRRRSRR